MAVIKKGANWEADAVVQVKSGGGLDGGCG